MEEHLRRALLLSRGNPMVFLTRPISLGFVIATMFIVVVMMAPTIRKRREDITG
jgi:putative tricarboxylic transport membrane protein